MTTLLSTLGAINYYTATDPYFYTVDNRPLTDLRNNIVTISNYIDNGDRGILDRTLSVASSGGVLVLTDVKDMFYTTLTENVTSVTAPTGVDGKQITVVIKQHASAAKTFVFGASFKLAGGAYTMTATLSKVDILMFKYVNAFTSWFEVSRTQNM